MQEPGSLHAFIKEKNRARSPQRTEYQQAGRTLQRKESSENLMDSSTRSKRGDQSILPTQLKTSDKSKTMERPPPPKDLRIREEPKFLTAIGKQVHSAFTRSDLQGEFNTEMAAWRSSITAPLANPTEKTGNGQGRPTCPLSGLGLGADKGANISDFTGSKHPSSTQPAQQISSAAFIPGPAEKFTFSSASKSSALPGSLLCIGTAACPCSKHEKIRNAKSI
jgi:hypothetical protein